MKKLLFSIIILLNTITVWSQGTFDYVGVASGTNTYTATILVPTFPSSYLGTEVRITFTNANTGASTINISRSSGAIGAAPIRKWDGDSFEALVSGDIPAGAEITLRYNTAGSYFIMDYFGKGSSGGGGGVTSVGTSSPLTGGTITSTGTIGITQSTTSTDGYLSSTDWNTFNGKQSTITVLPVVNGGTGVTTSTGTGNTVLSDSPLFTGNPNAPNQVYNSNTGNLATTAYADASSIYTPVNTFTSSHVAAISDVGREIRMNVASSNTFTIPPQSSVSFITNTTFRVTNYGAGQCTITPGAGVTFRNYSGSLTMDQYQTAYIKRVVADEWIIWINGSGAGSGDVSSNTSSSVDGEIALFNSTTGKSIKRAAGTGIAKITSGVLGTATSGTDYTSPSSTETQSNKSISLGSNTVTGTTAQFNTALSDNDFATLAGTETLTNKNLSSGTNTFPTFNQNTTGTASNVTGTVAIANGGTGQTAKAAAFNALSPNTTQGDIAYFDGTNNVRLAKSATATRYLANTGTSNSPAWDQVNLTNGVTGVLPSANGGLSGATAGGDISGTYPNPTVTKFQTVAVSSATPTTGQVMQYDGVNWKGYTSVSGSALTATGLNAVVTLGGSSTTALVDAASVNVTVDDVLDLTTTATLSGTSAKNVDCDGTGGAFTVTLPAASSVIGKVFHIQRTGVTGIITIARNGSDPINGSTTNPTLTLQYSYIEIQAKASGWIIRDSQ